jgi:universal stress protein A
MKFKPSHTPGNVLVELEQKDSVPFLSGDSRQNPSSLFKLKNILVPIDFSDCSKKALAYALPYAREFNAQITLLYVAQFYSVASEMDSVEPSALEGQHIERANKELQKLAQMLPSDLKIKTAVISGRPFQEIVAAAKALDSDLIIIGTHGAMGQQREFLGSTAERVIRYADCPILVVRQRERDFVETHRAKNIVKDFSRGRSAL